MSGGYGSYQVAMPEPSALPKKDSSIVARLQTIEGYLADAKRLMNAHPQDGLKVLLLPEYMFDRPLAPRPGMLRHRGGDVRQLSERQFHNIDNAMRDLSEAYPDLLIKVPVAWSKPIERATTQMQSLSSKGIDDETHPLHAHYMNQWSNKSTNTPSRREKAASANELGLSKFGDRHKHDFPDIDDNTRQLARNTVLTYFNGDVSINTIKSWACKKC